MARSKFSETHDAVVADQATKFDPLKCRADGCPNRWSVQKEGEQPLCSAHAWADPHMWPLITQEQRDAETDRALAAANPPPASKYVPKISKQRALEKLANFHFGDNVGRGWAREIIARHKAGEIVNIAALEMAKRATRFDSEELTHIENDRVIPKDVLPPAMRGRDEPVPFPPYEPR
jgi:hypothetical protein